jgi:DNA-directed RNA polymerase subunit M/transcription elongation factor TFIIS
MHFCSKCDNMYYIRISEEDGNKLIYYCRNCGNEDEFLNKENICVSKIELKRSEQKYSHIINKYTKFDPTLPRTNSIKCPNQTCLSNSTEVDKKVEREVIYIRYDDINIKYVYLCSTCDTLWRTNEIK